jgi:hypothetical protein
MPTTVDCSGRAEAGDDPLELRKMSHEALVRLVYRMLDDEKVWRQRWREEQTRRIALEERRDET